MDTVNEFLMAKKNKAEWWLQKGMKCKDGFTMSVQASSGHYCRPQKDEGPWSAVEVGFPSEFEELLMPYKERARHDPPTKAVYAWVPVEVVENVIEKHGGLMGEVR